MSKVEMRVPSRRLEGSRIQHCAVEFKESKALKMKCCFTRKNQRGRKSGQSSKSNAKVSQSSHDRWINRCERVLAETSPLLYDSVMCLSSVWPRAKPREEIWVPVVSMFKGGDLSVLPEAKDIMIQVWALSDASPILSYSSHELEHGRE